MDRLLIYIIVLLLASQASFGQELTSPIRFTNYTVAEGLPSSRPNSLMQDSRGFIWISTSQGLARFDGNRFIVYRHSRKDSSSIPMENVNWCVELKNNELLLSSGAWLWMLNTVNQQQHAPPSFWRNKENATVYKIINNRLAITSGDKIYFTDNALQVTDSVYWTEAWTYGIISLGNNRLLLSNGSRLFCYSLENKKFREWKIPVDDLKPGGFYTVNNTDTVNKILYLVEYFKGVFEMSYDEADANFLKPRPIKNLTSGGATRNFLLDHGTGIVGSESGLSIVREGQTQINVYHISGDNSSLLPGYQEKIIPDHTGNLWSLGEAGISKFNLQQLNFSSWKLPYNLVISMSSFSKYDGKIYMSNEQTGSLYLDLKTRRLHLIDSSVIAYCWGVAPVNENIYIYGNATLGRYANPRYNVKLLNYNIQSKKLSRPGFLDRFYKQSDLLTMIYQSRNGDIWYSLNHGGGIVRQLSKSRTFIQYNRNSNPSTGSFSYVYNVAEDRQNDIYFSVNRNNKILVWKNKEQHFVEWKIDSLLHSKEHFENVVQCHTIDSNNTIWISVDQRGLVRYNLSTGIGKFYTAEDGLLSNNFDDIVVDETGNLWIPSEMGLSCLLTATDRFINFTQEDGLPFTNFYGSYLYFDKEDTSLYFSKSGYLYKINTGLLISRKKESAARLFIDKMEVNAAPYYFANSRQVALKPEQNNIQFSFTLLDIDQKVPQRNYEYLLTNGSQQEQWQKLSGTNVIAFTNLPPGSYTLQVRLFNEATNAYITGSNIFHFTIATTWYKTTWFISFCLLTGAFIIWSFIRQYYQGQLEKQQALLEKERALEAERSRIAADMHDDVGAGLSRIRYITTAIKEGNNLNNDDMDKILSLSDESVEKMNEIIWSLNKGNQQLAELIYHIRSQCAEMVSNATIEFTCTMPDDIPPLTLGWKEARNIYLVVKETVNNAIKHAGAKNIFIDFIINHQLRITVKDDGKGFDENSIRKQGNGLLNYKKRVESTNGSYSIKTSPGNGTELHFVIPLAGK